MFKPNYTGFFNFTGLLFFSVVRCGTLHFYFGSTTLAFGMASQVQAQKRGDKNAFFVKTNNCSNDDRFINSNDTIGKTLHKICSSAVTISLNSILFV